MGGCIQADPGENRDVLKIVEPPALNLEINNGSVGTASASTAPPALPPRIPHLTIRPRSAWWQWNLGEVWRFRDLLLALSGRDLKLRYKQTALGVVWVVFQPLMAALIFAFVFGKVAKMPSSGVPYLVFAFAGLLAWNLFSNVLTKASACLVGNAHLVSKVYFPRLILPLSMVPSALVDFAVAGGLMSALLLAYGIVPGAALALLPLWGALILALSLGLGLTTAALAVRYRDIQYILPVALQILLYASPVAYALSAVPDSFRVFYDLNPLAILLEGFRWSLLGAGTVTVAGAFYAAVVCLMALVVGIFAFKRMERSFADVI